MIDAQEKNSKLAQRAKKQAIAQDFIKDYQQGQQVRVLLKLVKF